ncbi:DNA methyltransferase [Vagococcus zengguangii]|uniref:Site-specific DNA-methyltransferase n=1 Tax=Vagococcus zengguangii TaxID=2571750 RepID=A0A4D7CX38_9ENTE|nr:site-specific DNA-methyltransferase [Vagococcus zengguangii]QCI86630.1 site-specific DNA-methyltransferase [Vagococcus zengguangii]
METKINQAIKSVLLMFGDKYFIGEIINKQKVIQDLDNYDKELMAKMLSNDVVKSNFTMAINDAIIFNVNKLVELFETNDYWQDSYTKYSKKIGLTTNGKFIDEATEVVLDFPYKDTVLKAGMTKEDLAKDDLRPDEPFLNEVIAKEEIDVLLDKKLLVNAKKYDVEGEHDVSEITDEDNLVIKGNNLFVLHSLKARFTNKISGIFCDPPYYFSKKKQVDAFKYNSNFKLSTWLTFCKNRFEIAKDLLNEDGILAITIGVDGYAHLKLLLDEIFEISNHPNRYIGTITWRKTDNQSNIGEFANVVDYILLYRKNSNSKLNRLPLSEKAQKEYSYTDSVGKYRRSNILDLTRGRYTYSIETPDGEILNGPWMIEEQEFIKLKEKDEIHWPSKGKKIPYGKTYLKYALNNGQISSDFWDSSFGTNQRSADEIKLLFGSRIFDFAKPEKLLMNIVNLISNENDLILDFFMGSATTQAVAMKMNRRFIGIEQMDYINTVSVPRLQKVIEGEQGGISKDVDWQGGGSFVYAELMEKNTGFLKEIIEAATMQELQVIFERMSQSPDIDFRVDLEEVKATLWEHSLEEQKKTLIKILDKNQLYFNYSEIDDAHVRELVSDSDYAFNQSFYKEVNQDG